MDTWKARHNRAFENVQITGYGTDCDHVGGPVVALIKAWIALAEKHEKAFGQTVGNDGFACDPWCSMGRQIHEMLNMDCGRMLDMGTLSSLMYATLKKHTGREDFSITV